MVDLPDDTLAGVGDRRRSRNRRAAGRERRTGRSADRQRRGGALPRQVTASAFWASLARSGCGHGLATAHDPVVRITRQRAQPFIEML